MKVLVFGSNGLVGSSLGSILKESNKVTDLIQSKRSELDLFDFEKTKFFIQSHKPNVVINAAAKVGGIFTNNTNRTEFILENLKINMNILESCIPFPDIKIINLGSSCIYPVNAENPINEKSFMTGQLEETNSPYAMAKISAIEIGRSLNQQFGHRVVNLMPTNLYGPNDLFSETESHVIPGIMYRMHQSKFKKIDEFSIWGSGKPLREFLYVDDLSMAIEFLLDKDPESDLINIGSGEEISILDLANLIKKIIGYEGEIRTDLGKPDGNPRKLVDSKIINDLGWFSETSLEDGLDKTYDWFLRNIKNLRS